MTATTQTAKKVSKFAVPFLGLLGAVQGTCPNIASTALVGASKALDMQGSTLALAASVQTLAVAASAITTGLIADRIGRRLMLMIALVIGAVGNVIVMLSPASEVYMLGMFVVGVGLGAVYGCAFGYLRAVVPPNKFGGAMGLFTATVMTATVIMTFIGGTLASSNWRIAYVLIPSVCVVTLLLTPIVLPKIDKLEGQKLDLFGQGALIVAVVSFLYSVSQFATSLTAPKTLIPLGIGLVFFAVFFVREAKYSGHFYPVRLFKEPVFLAAICAGLIYNFGTAVSFLQVTNLWQYINGLKTSEVAIWQLPLMGAGIVSGLVVGRLMTKGLSNRMVILSGAVCSAVGFALLAVFNTSKDFVGFLPGLVLVGAGVVVAAVPYGSLILREAPPSDVGPVTSSRLTIGQIFYTLGLSASTVLIDRLTTGGVVDKLTAAGVPPNQLSTGLDAVTAYASTGTPPSTALGQQALQAAISSYGDAFAVAMYLTAGLVLVVGILGFFLLRHDQGTPATAPAAS